MIPHLLSSSHLHLYSFCVVKLGHIGPLLWVRNALGPAPFFSADESAKFQVTELPVINYFLSSQRGASPRVGENGGGGAGEGGGGGSPGATEIKENGVGPRESQQGVRGGGGGCHSTPEEEEEAKGRKRKGGDGGYSNG